MNLLAGFSINCIIGIYEQVASAGERIDPLPVIQHPLVVCQRFLLLPDNLLIA
jgi:hypothetical protein